MLYTHARLGATSRTSFGLKPRRCSGEEYDDPRIDGLVAQLKAQSKIAQPSVFSPTSFVRVSKADEASDDEDEAEYLRQRQRGRGDASAIS